MSVEVNRIQLTEFRGVWLTRSEEELYSNFLKEELALTNYSKIGKNTEMASEIFKFAKKRAIERIVVYRDEISSKDKSIYMTKSEYQTRNAPKTKI